MSETPPPFKVALCQIPVTDDKLHNLQVAQSYLQRAHAAKARLAILPECFQTPYDTACFSAYAEPLPEPPHPPTLSTESPTLAMLQKNAIETGMYIVGGSIPERSSSHIHNTSITISPDGTLIAKHRKAHLFDIDIPNAITFRESDVLTPGNSPTAFKAPQLHCNIGVAICYDLRFPELAMIQARNLACDVLVYPGAFNLTTGPAHWELLLRARAVDNQVFVAACSPARNVASDGYQAWGHSMLVDPWGRVLAEADEGEQLVLCEVDLSRVHAVRQQIPTRQQRREDIYTLRFQNE